MRAYLVHYDAPQWCRESVEALVQSRGVEVTVTVLNNGGTVDLPDGVSVVETGRNLGYAGAANVGLDLAEHEAGDYIFVGCHDIRPDRDALRAMIRMLESDADLGLVGPVLDGAGGTEHDLEWISGAGFLMRHDLCHNMRFNELYGSYVEDVDFCFRLRDRGWRVGRAGDAGARTRGSADSRAAVVRMHANTIIFFLSRRLWKSAAARALLVTRITYRSPRTGMAIVALTAAQGYRFLLARQSVV